MATLKPQGDRIIVRENDTRNLPSGLVLPDSVQNRTQIGVVLAVGPGPRSPFSGEIARMDIQEGDRVMWGLHAGMELEVNDELLLCLRETDIIATVRGDGSVELPETVEEPASV